MNTQTPHQISRRTIVGAGALGAAFLAVGTSAVATPAYAADNQNGALPAIDPDISSAFVFWAPTAAVSGLFNEGPAGLSIESVQSKLSKLLISDKGGPIGVVPEYGFTIGGASETSTQTLALRSAAHPYKPNFYYNGQNGMMPRTGQVILSTVDGRIPGAGNPFYGHIGGVYCSIEQVPNRPNKVLVKVQGDGVDRGTTPVKVGSGAASWIRSGFEAYHRGHRHLLWMGRENIEETDQVLSDIRAAYAVEPETSVVIGHFAAGTETTGTAKAKAIGTLNTKLAAEYGDRFFDAQAALRDPELWAVPELAEYRIGSSVRDRDWMAKGLPPYSLFGSDERRLNKLGNRVLAYGLHRFLTGKVDLYPAAA